MNSNLQLQATSEENKNPLNPQLQAHSLCGCSGRLLKYFIKAQP